MCSLTELLQSLIALISASLRNSRWFLCYEICPCWLATELLTTCIYLITLAVEYFKGIAACAFVTVLFLKEPDDTIIAVGVQEIEG